MQRISRTSAERHAVFDHLNVLLMFVCLKIYIYIYRYIYLSISIYRAFIGISKDPQVTHLDTVKLIPDCIREVEKECPELAPVDFVH